MKFEALDSLRGFAALAVAVFHFRSGWGGYLAVDFFLVLSGFVLSHSYMYKDAAISPIEFVGRRLARLYPIHFLTIFTFIAAFACVNKHLPSYPDGSLFTFFQNLTLTQNVGLNPSGLTYNYPSWSVSVEFWVNVMFIFFVGRSTGNATLFAISLAGIALIITKTGHLDIHYPNYFEVINSGLVRGVSSFFVGIISYRLYLCYRDDVRVKKYIDYLEVISVAVIFVIIFGRVGKFSKMDMIAPFAFMFAIAIFSLEGGLFSKRLRKYKYLGEISYSMYLNHVTVLLLFEHAVKYFPLPVWLVIPAYLGVVVVYSCFTYEYVEKPLTKKFRNLLTLVNASRAKNV